MARRRRRRAERGEGARILAGAALAGLALVALGGLLYGSRTVDRPPVLDAGTLCPLDGPQSLTVVLLDGSDSLPPVAQRQVATMLADLAETLPDHGLLEMRLLDPAAPDGRLIFSRCNPGSGAGLSEWTANPQAARRRWLADFREPIGQLLAAGLPPAPAEVSPIMAAIQAVAVSRFEGRAAAAVDKQLIVVSDMIENTPAYSQYRGDLDYARFAGLPAARALGTDLHGAAVTVYYVQRDTPIDSAAHLRFWQRWFEENGGRLVEAVKLQGTG